MSIKISPKILLQFQLSWDDLDFGLKKGWITEETVARFAIQRAYTHDDLNEIEFMLCSVSPSDTDSIRLVLDQLISGEALGDVGIHKWSCILLSELWRVKEKFQDPLAEVEEIYADLGYPEEVAPLVRYMPTADGYRPQDHRPEDNIKRIYEKWQAFVENCSR